MKKLFLSVFFLSLIFHAQSQDVKLYNNGGHIGYGENGFINTTDSLPKEIQDVVSVLINGYFGDLSDSVTFVRGQIIDMDFYCKRQKAYMKDRLFDFYAGKLMPSYSLLFSLQDSTLGITRYSFNLYLDDYGRVLDIAWPIKGYNSRNGIKKMIDVQSFLVRIPKYKSRMAKDYEVGIIYDKESEKMYWTFRFPNNFELKQKSDAIFNHDLIYDVINVDLKNIENTKEFQVVEDKMEIMGF